MKIMPFVRSQAHAIYALAAVFLGAVALAALEAYIPDQALGALRSLSPGAAPFLALLLLGWLGVGLGCLTIKPAPSPAENSKPAAPARRDTPDKDKEEKVDRVLRQVAKVLQSHMTDSESFSERLDGHNQRLSRHETVGPIKEIVLALIEDNRDMRDRLDNVRNQLEESRLQVVQLQTNLERAEDAGLRDVVTAIGNRRFFDSSFIEEVEKPEGWAIIFALRSPISTSSRTSTIVSAISSATAYCGCSPTSWSKTCADKTRSRASAARNSR